MSSSSDHSDQIKHLQDVEEEWAQLRKDELELVQMLQAKAAAEQELMKQLLADGDPEGAERAREREQVYLQQADDLVKQAKETVRRQGDVEAQESRTRGH